MSGGGRELRLDDIAVIVTGATPKSCDELAWGDEVDFVTPSDQVAGRRDARAERRLSSAGVELLKRRLVPAGATALTCIGSTIGKVSRLREASVTNQQINTLVARDGIADSSFLYYMILNWSSALKGTASGSATPIVSKSVLAQSVFVMPDFRVQMAVGEVLDSLDNKIAANDAIAIATDAYLAEKFAVLTQKVNSGVLGEIADVNLRTCKRQQDGFIRYLDISALGRGVYDFPLRTLWANAPARAKRGVKAGDVVWSTVRPGRQSHALILDEDPELVASTGLAVLSPRTDRAAGLYEATKTAAFAFFLEGVAEGSAYPAVRGERFMEAPIPRLDDSQWKWFEDLAMPLRRRVHAAQVQTRLLSAMRDELTPLLISGAIRVKDAEEVVEEVL